jgi:hypothetical protein
MPTTVNQMALKRQIFINPNFWLTVATLSDKSTAQECLEMGLLKQ